MFLKPLYSIHKYSIYIFNIKFTQHHDACKYSSLSRKVSTDTKNINPDLKHNSRKEKYLDNEDFLQISLISF